jgi:RNA polymerase sigma-70 factor (ECF subfamily)
MVLNMINSMGIDKNLRAQALNDIDDIVNDTMLKLYKGMRDFKRESTFKTWAYAIARNVLVDYLRHLSVKTCRRMDMDVSDLAPHHHPAADIATNPLALLLEDEQIQGQREKLHRYLDALPSKFKAVGNLLLMGKSYQQIADQLQIPLNTVRTRIYRLTNRAHRSDD